MPQTVAISGISCLDGESMAASPSEMTEMASATANGISHGEIYSKARGDELPLLTKKETDSALDSQEATGRSVEEMEKTLQDMEAKYAAYVRNDIYGVMGVGDMSLWQKGVLVFALLFLVPIKVLLLFTIIFTYYLICKICTVGGSSLHDGIEGNNGDDSSITPLNNDSAKSDGHVTFSEADSSPKHDETYLHLSGLRKTVIVMSGRFFSRAILFVLGFFWITVTHKDTERARKDGGASDEPGLHPSAIVSNHVSYLDILYHMSASFPSFVAKRSVARLYLIGLISKCLGCVYVQREDKPSDFKGVAETVRERLRLSDKDKEAPIMLLFPEGTTTNGNHLLPFKTGAFVAGTPVQPVILKYPYRRFSPAWDTISGVRHAILLLCQFVNHLEVVWLPIYTPSEKEKADPRLYASNVRNLMASEGQLTLADIGLQEKRIYHSFLNDYLISKPIG